jgi:hypothetical protein
MPTSSPHLPRRVDAVARVLAGEPMDAVAEELGVPARTLDAWVKEFSRAGETRLRQLPDNWVDRTLSPFEKLVPLATLLSVLIAVVLFVQGQRKEAAERAHADALAQETRVRDAYTALDDRYLDYVKLCLDHPDLDTFDTPLAHPPPPTPDRQRREAMVLSVLTSVLERAYLMFGSGTDPFEQAQWAAWAAYIRAWAARQNFRAEWAVSRTEYDAGFAAYVDTVVAATPATTRPAG